MLNVAASSSRSSVRALDVFRAFQIARRPLSLTELSHKADIAVSTCHGVMKLLAKEGYLYFLSGKEAYPTRRLWEMTQEIQRHDPVVQVLEPMLRKLRDEVDETVILGVRQGDEVVYLLVLESAQAIRYSSEVGAHKPLHSSSIGKVMLSRLSSAELDAWLRKHPLRRVTPNTITMAADLRRDLAATIDRNYSVTRGENVADVMAIAAPVHFGGTTLAVAIAGPMTRMEAKEQQLAKRLLQAARTMERSAAATKS